MKLFILHPFVAGPYGGGNQFLKALREELRRQGAYAETSDEATAILVNANPGSLPYLLQRLTRIHKPILVRIDGPVALVRGKDAFLDRLLVRLVHLFADGVVWQSTWSKDENKRLYAVTAPREVVIHNAPDPKIFFPPTQLKPAEKTRLIATSWSANPRKGFAVYSYLDEHLDFSRYALTFVGNTPVPFKNIKTVAPVSSEHLASLLREHDVYLTASEHDPCSNALLEALVCGLPTVARRSGGHPELVQRGGELFADSRDVLAAIERVAGNREHYRAQIPQRSIAEVATAYLDAARTLTKRRATWPRPLQSAATYGQYVGYQALKALMRR